MLNVILVNLFMFLLDATVKHKRFIIIIENNIIKKNKT